MDALESNASLANMEGNILDVSDYNSFITKVKEVLERDGKDSVLVKYSKKKRNAHRHIHVAASKVMRSMFVVTGNGKLIKITLSRRDAI